MKEPIKLQKLPLLVILLATGFAGQAQAQSSNVTMYGYIDLGLVKESGTTPRLDRGYNNWLGFKGTEDLGDGLSAIFNLQMRFKPDTGVQETGALFQGESTIGIASKSFGKIRLGRALTPFWQEKWLFEPWYDSQFMGSVGGYQNGSYSSDPTYALGYANWARIPHGVFYDSPNMSGFEVRVASEVDKAVGATARTMGVALNYAKGPLGGMFSFERNNNKDDIYFLGASYNFGVTAVMGSYSKVQLTGAPNSEKNYVLAGTYALGTDTLRLGYGRTSNIGGTAIEAKKDKFSVGYNHPLSKRTNVYADIYREKTTDSMNGFAIGMNHSF